MPSNRFLCPDGNTVSIEECLKPNGCRMKQRCASLPFLRSIAYDREWRGVSPSAAGNGPRLMYLKATKDYVVDPESRVFAILGTATHAKLGDVKFTSNVLSEEKLSDGDMQGIADVLEEDEANPGHFALIDYKTFGSYKAAKVMGIAATKEAILNSKGQPVLLKSGKNKGKPKIRKIFTKDPAKAELRNETLQLNAYRCFFERSGFPVSRIMLQVIPRDGGTYIAKLRGIEKNLYMVDVPFMPDDEVRKFYHDLQAEVNEAFRTGWIRRCNAWESWGGRRCSNYCEVADACAEMDKGRK
jgi:hypothetical protein